MPVITLPDGSQRSFDQAVTVAEVAASIGAGLAKVLGSAPAALMRGHGAVVVGQNIARAVGRSVYLEMSAQMQLQAMALAGPNGNITFLDHGEVQASAPVQDYYRAWPMWREKALAGLGAN